MRLFGGLKPEDWRRWGQFTTFKENAAELLRRELRAEQRIYCSPLVDPYQPAEASVEWMPELLRVVRERPPRVFTIQTRGLLILRDIELLREIPGLRLSFSVPTNREEVLKLYEPHAPTFEERGRVIRELVAAGIETYATLAPLLPCDPEELAKRAIEWTGRDLIGDPLHVREEKPRGATTWGPAWKIAEVRGHKEWLDARFQREVVERVRAKARDLGKEFEVGPEGFSRLAR